MPNPTKFKGFWRKCQCCDHEQLAKDPATYAMRLAQWRASQ